MLSCEELADRTAPDQCVVLRCLRGGLTAELCALQVSSRPFFLASRHGSCETTPFRVVLVGHSEGTGRRCCVGLVV